MDRRSGVERRRSVRHKAPRGQRLTFWAEDDTGGWTRHEAEIGDRSDQGVGLILSRPVEVGQAVMVEGEGFSGGSGGRQKGTIRWCRPTVDGRFRAGIELALAVKVPESPADDFVDHYEVMELSQAASLETIHRIYRILAQRLHPDNTETGSTEAFKSLTEAYRILSDPEKRAAFDCARNARQRVHWQVFDQNSAAPSMEQEQTKRREVLKALYLKRLRDGDHPGMNLVEFEALLGMPREHLDFTMWFLKEQGWVARTDNGRYSITVKGVEQSEQMKVWDQRTAETKETQHLQLEAAY